MPSVNPTMPPFNFTTLLLLALFLFSLIKLIKKRNKSSNLPPGPPELPVIGHLHHLLGAELLHRTLAKLSREYGPIMHLRLGQLPTVVISSREAARQALKTHDPACADRHASMGGQIMWYDNKDIIFCPYSEYWRQMRKICIIELLSPKNVRSFGSIRRDEADRMIGSLRLSSGRPVNVTELIFAFTSSIMCRAAFGEVGIGDPRALVAMIKKGVEMVGGFEIVDFFPGLKLLHVLSWNRYKLLRMRRRVDAILDKILEQHRVKRSGEFGGEDIVDVFLRMQKNGELEFPITNDNIKAIIFDMFSAGTETSSTTIDWAMAELMRNPSVMSKAQKEIRDALEGKGRIEERDLQGLKYLKLVIKETLRLHPPNAVIMRTCRDTFTIDGYTIKEKSRIMVNALAMGRNHEYWPEPERFKPERFEDGLVDFLGNDFEFLPFGAGKRICPGMNFGLANVELPLAHLLYYFDWKMPQGMGPNDVDMSETEGLLVPRKNGLVLVPEVYNPPLNA